MGNVVGGENVGHYNARSRGMDELDSDVRAAERDGDGAITVVVDCSAETADERVKVIESAREGGEMIVDD